VTRTRLALVVLAAACHPDPRETADTSTAPSFPLAPDSPWPKFRANPRQDGQAAVGPATAGASSAWTYTTGKGIFSSPVVGGDGTVYVGSADRSFYAISATGELRWKVETGEIIDSSALLDDEGRVVFGSGDGQLRALDTASGDLLWSFSAENPATTGAFINWFEGNVAIGPGGDLYAPNDNFRVYAVDRATGAARWSLEMKDQTWSLPAVDGASGNLYLGNNNLLEFLGDNTFAVDSEGHALWSAGSDGSVAASPLLDPDGRVFVGGFDGYLRAYDAASGDSLWTFGARDHLYASPARLSDGTIVQPSADGTVYALDPATGEVRWAFDTREPIRSSPAVDAEDHVYFGSGDGRLYVLDPDGTLRWARQLCDADRNDLNASPALGSDAVFIAGESGEIWAIPYDLCLSAPDEACIAGPHEDLPADGATLMFTSRYGSVLDVPPSTVDPTDALAFTLFAREGGDTLLALLDADSLSVAADPAVALTVEISGDRRFFTIVPEPAFFANADGQVRVRVSGTWLVNPDREGLRFEGGEPGGTFDQTFLFDLRTDGPAAFPLPVPGAAGVPVGVWELSRLAAPLPTLLPSYNQIGFDSLHFLVSLVEGDERAAVGWVMGAVLDDAGQARPDPATGVLFPVAATMDRGALTLDASSGMSLQAMNLDIAFDRFRTDAHLDATGAAPDGAVLSVTTLCGDITFYGAFMRVLGLCNPQTDALDVFGAALLEPWNGGAVTPPVLAAGVLTWTADGDGVTVEAGGSGLEPARDLIGLLVLDADTGAPLPLSYGTGTERTTDCEGYLETVSVPWGDVTPPARVRAWLLVGPYPAASEELDVAP